MRARVALLLTILGLVMAFTAAPVAAASLTVNSTADTAPADDGSCTLREAIIAADSDTASGALPGECAAGSGADQIMFSVSGTITLVAALPPITTDVVIDGGAAITVDGAGAFRPFLITGGIVALSGLAIVNGLSAGDYGGGIRVDSATLTITDSTISGNAATGGVRGGGIAQIGGTLVVTGSTISGNTAPGGGGITSIDVDLTVANSTISGNTGDVFAGGIWHSSGPAIVMNSTISGNTAGALGGGGIYVQGDFTVANSTISGNSTVGTGGGYINAVGTSTFANSTISGNTAAVAGGIGAAGNEVLVNTIVAGNTSAAGTDIGGGAADTVTTSIIGVPSGMTLADILVSAGLADNGGPTETIALAQVAGNPAIDTGDGATCAAAPVNGVDQRGLPRPVLCDIGAFEVQQTPATTPAASLPNAATAPRANGSPLATLGFGVLLMGALGAVAVMNLGFERRR